MLSRSAAYAVRAAVLLAGEPRLGAPLSVERIAHALGAPRNYLSKVLHALATHGAVSSKRGPGGGFALAVPPESLTIARVIAPFESPPQAGVCVLGSGRCSERTPCEAHDAWSPVGRNVRDFLDRTTIADLARSAPHPRVEP